MSSRFTTGNARWPALEVDAPRLFRLERDRLLALLSGVSPEEWLRPTPCPGWSLLGLSAHLLGDDLSWLARHRDGYLGTASPQLEEEEFPVWLDEMQIEWVNAARRLSPQLVIDLLRWSCPQIVEVLAEQDPTAMTASVSWADPGPAPVWLDQVRELSERWIHRQQLLQSLHEPPDLREDVAGPVLDGLRWAYRYRLSTVPGHEGDTVRITVTGDLAREWYLVRSVEDWDFASDEGARVVATMTMSADQAWRLLTNNLPPDQQAEILMEGDAMTVAALRRTRAIIGLPK